MPKATAASIGKKRSLSAVDRVHAYMGLTRVCDKEQISKDLGEKFIRTIGTLVTKGEIARSEEHTSELQSLMRISYAVFCLKKKTQRKNTKRNNNYITHHMTTKT